MPQLIDDRAEALEGHALAPALAQVAELDELAPDDDVLPVGSNRITGAY